MFLHLLTLVFVIAKILGYVAWSWWLVMAPSLVAVALGLFFLLLTLVIGVAAVKTTTNTARSLFR